MKLHADPNAAPPLAADANAPPAQACRIAGAFVGIAAACVHPPLAIPAFHVAGSLVLAAKLQQSEPQGDLTTRALLLGCYALAGCVAGRSLSRDAAGDSARHPRDLLRSASALTAGIFAVLVTFTFLLYGLDTARTFSSRLSTSLTILVTTVSVP